MYGRKTANIICRSQIQVQEYIRCHWPHRQQWLATKCNPCLHVIHMAQSTALKFTNPSSSSLIQLLPHNSHAYRLLIILRSLLSLVPRAHVSPSRQPRDSASPKPAVPSHLLSPFSILTRPHGLTSLTCFKPIFCFPFSRYQR